MRKTEFTLLMYIVAWVAGHVSNSLARTTSVEEIVDAWRKRGDRYESATVRWDENRLNAAGSLGESESGQPLPESNVVHPFSYSLKLKLPSSFWLTRTGAGWYSEDRKFVSRRYVSVNSQGVAKSFYDQVDDDPAKYPAGYISYQPSDWDNFHILPVLLFLRPVNDEFCPLKDGEYKIGKSEFVEGYECITLRPAAESTAVQYIYYVDPESEYVVRKFDKFLANRLLWSTRISYASKEGVPMIDSWQTQIFHGSTGEVTEQHDGKIANINFDELSIEDFNFRFPDDTLVTDRTGKDGKPVVFVTGRDEQKRVVTSAERQNGIQYDRYLKTKSGEAVDVPASRGSLYFYLIGGSLIAGIVLFCIRHFLSSGHRRS